MNFDDMSDKEINDRIAELLKIDEPTQEQVDHYAIGCMSDSSVPYWISESTIGWLDYCNSWTDMGPLIAEHNICLNHASGCTKEAFVRDSFGFVEFTGEDNGNILRAAAICLIKKLEANYE